MSASGEAKAKAPSKKAEAHKAREADAVKREALKTNARLKKYLRNLQDLELKTTGTSSREGKEEKKVVARTPKAKKAGAAARATSNTATAAATLPATHPILETKAGASDISHSISAQLGVFGAPAAALSIQLEFAHVANSSFVSSCQRLDPLAFVSFDVKMAAGRSTSEEHQKYFEGLLLPLISGPDLPREFRGLQIHVETIGELVRVTVMGPNPKTFAQRLERETKRLAKATRGKDESGDSGETIPDSDEDLVDKENPVEILQRMGIDYSTLIKRLSLRVETAVSLDTLAEDLKADTPWWEIFRARARLDACFDPAIVKSTLASLVSVLGDPGADKLADLANAYFSTFVKHTNIQLQFHDLQNIFNAIRQIKPLDDAQAAREIKSRAKSEELFMYLLNQPYWRFLSVIADEESRSSYRYKDNVAILTAFKTFTTILAKDVDELSAVHVRAKTGQGISWRFDRLIPIRSINALAHRVVIHKPADYTEY